MWNETKLPDSVIDVGGEWFFDQETGRGADFIGMPWRGCRERARRMFLTMAQALVEHDKAEKQRLKDPSNWPEKMKTLHREIFSTVD